jgi:hypothetical protein
MKGTPYSGFAAGFEAALDAAAAAIRLSRSSRDRNRRAIFCLRSLWKRAVSPHCFDMLISQNESLALTPD